MIMIIKVFKDGSNLVTVNMGEPYANANKIPINIINTCNDESVPAATIVKGQNKKQQQQLYDIKVLNARLHIPLSCSPSHHLPPPASAEPITTTTVGLLNDITIEFSCISMGNPHTVSE